MVVNNITWFRMLLNKLSNYFQKLIPTLTYPSAKRAKTERPSKWPRFLHRSVAEACKSLDDHVDRCHGVGGNHNFLPQNRTVGDCRPEPLHPPHCLLDQLSRWQYWPRMATIGHASVVGEQFLSTPARPSPKIMRFKWTLPDEFHGATSTMPLIQLWKGRMWNNCVRLEMNHVDSRIEVRDWLLLETVCLFRYTATVLKTTDNSNPSWSFCNRK